MGEFRRGVRTLARTPVFTTAIIAMLAVGAGACTAIFSVIDTLLIRPLPFPDQEQLVAVANAWPLFQDASTDGEVRGRPAVFDGLASIEIGRATLGGAAAPDVVRLARTSRSYFSVLAVGAHIGQTFSTVNRDSRGAQVAVLGYAVWQRHLGGDPAAVGRQIALNGRWFTIIAIMPVDFRFLVRGHEVDVWVPLDADDSLLNTAQQEGSATIARLSAGLTLQEAQSGLDLVFERLRQSRPQLRLRDKDRMTLLRLRDAWFGSLRSPLWMLLGAALCLLAIVCANSLSLMSARAADTQKDMAIRTALGAGRVQMLRQHLSECVLLGIAGAVLGLLIAHWAVAGMIAVAPASIPHRAVDFRINLRIVPFAFVVSIFVVTAPGLLAAWRVARAPLDRVIREGAARGGSARSPRMRTLLVIGEVGLTMLVLINAGLLFRSFRALLHQPLGFDATNVLTVEVAPVDARYPDRQRRSELYDRILERITNVPGVAHAGTVNYLPIFSGSLIVPVNVQEHTGPDAGWSWTYRVASADYFTAMSIPLIAGRTFNATDGTNAPFVAVLDQSAAALLAKATHPDDRVIGKHLILNLGKPTAVEIIGIVGDIRQQGLGIPTYPGFYLHARQRPPAVANVVIRTSVNASGMVDDIRAAISEADRELPVSGVRLMKAQVIESVSRRRFALVLTAVLGAGTLLMAMIGFYSVMTFVVSHRTREIGVRIALGADVRDILKLVAGQAVGLIGSGIALGTLISLAGARMIASALVGVGSADPTTLLGVMAIVAAVGAAASYAPTRRAMRVDPIEILRSE